MRYYIQPVVKRLGIKKGVTWHTFRRTYTTLLHANGEDVKVVQGLLRHSSSRITMDIYARAQMPANGRHSRKWWRWCGRKNNPPFANTHFQPNPFDILIKAF